LKKGSRVTPPVDLNEKPQSESGIVYDLYIPGAALSSVSG
jgi:hypothetical protein